MTLRLITPSATFPVTLAEAKWHLRVEHSDDDALIDALIPAALSHAEKTTGQPFEPQTWELVIDAFPANEVQLPLGPVVSVTSVKYDDADGVEQTVDSADYEVDTVSADGWVVPSGTWPTAMATINAVRVRFVVGAGSPEDVKQAVLLILGLWYDTRHTAGTAMQEIPYGAEAILSLHRRIYI